MSTADTIRFVFWMLRRKVPTTYIDVMQAFDVSRPTAFRWLSEYELVTAKRRVPVYGKTSHQKPPTGLVP
jgi:hypothetical protein